MALPGEYHIVWRIPSDLYSLSLFYLLIHHFIPSESSHKAYEKMNINTLGFLWPDEEKLVLFLINSQEEA